MTALTLAIDEDGNIRELDNRHGIPYSIEDYDTAERLRRESDNPADVLKGVYGHRARQNTHGTWYIERGNIE